MLAEVVLSYASISKSFHGCLYRYRFLCPFSSGISSDRSHSDNLVIRGFSIIHFVIFEQFQRFLSLISRFHDGTGYLCPNLLPHCCLSRKQNQKIKTQQVSVEAKQTFLQESKALKTTSFVLGAVMASLVPFTFFYFAISHQFNCCVFALEAAFHSLAFWNSVCNPLIYCARSSEYRTAFKKLLCLKQNQVHPAGLPTRLQEI